MTLYRWHAISVVFFLLFLYVIVRFFVPEVSALISEVDSIKDQKAYLEEADSIPGKIRELREQAETIESLIEEAETREGFKESAFLDSLYRYADSTKCDIIKTDIGERIETDVSSEIPVSVRIKSSYKSIGKFTERIENTSLMTRINSITIKRKSSSSGDVSIEFVVMESKEH